MKKQTYLLFLTILMTTGISLAQELSDSVRINEYLPVRHADPIGWIKRYQTDIDKYVNENRSSNNLSCDVLFLGSSSIHRWKNIHEDMAPMEVIKRSYGGATIRDLLYNYDVIARGYRPLNIVLYVENDLCGCKEALSVGELYDLFRVFIQKIQQDYPKTPFYILSLKPSFVRADQLKKQLIINLLLKEYCEQQDNLHFVDITQCMYDDQGDLLKDIFESDNLHINSKGYALWTAILKPLLLKNSNK